MPDLLKNLTHTDYLVVGTGVAGAAGGVSYWLSVVEGRPFKWSEFVVHILASMLFGYLAFELGSYEGVPDEFCGAMAGAAGLMGTRIARIFEVILPKLINALVLKYFGLSKADLEEQEQNKKESDF